MLCGMCGGHMTRAGNFYICIDCGYEWEFPEEMKKDWYG